MKFQTARRFGNEEKMQEVKRSRCRNRIGNQCKELDQRLELVSVEKELEFDQPDECKGGIEK